MIRAFLTQPLDTDGDGTANYLDEDSDDDGLGDQVEDTETLTDPYENDTDSDGLNDGIEIIAATNPLDQDSDDDSILDGSEGTGDLDGDGLVRALDPDSDNDGVFDGTETGVTGPSGAVTYRPRRFTRLPD